MTEWYSSLQLPRGYDLRLVLHPSFALPLLKIEDGLLVKARGGLRGAWVRVGTGAAWSSRADFAAEILGLASVAEAYSRSPPPPGPLWLGVARSPWDPTLIAATVLLSRRTSYYGNVVRWASRLAELMDELGSLARAASRLAGEYSSYQVEQLASVAAELEEATVEAVDLARGGSLWEARARLMRVKYVGPKVADATLLFAARGCTILAPGDVHLARIVRVAFGVDASQPVKSWCRSSGFDCTKCRVASRCASGVVVSRFGWWAGIVQTWAYVADTLYCPSRLCSSCILAPLCRSRVGSPRRL